MGLLPPSGLGIRCTSEVVICSGQVPCASMRSKNDAMTSLKGSDNHAKAVGGKASQPILVPQRKDLAARRTSRPVIFGRGSRCAHCRHGAVAGTGRFQISFQVPRSWSTIACGEADLVAPAPTVSSGDCGVESRLTHLCVAAAPFLSCDATWALQDSALASACVRLCPIASPSAHAAIRHRS